MGAVLYWWVTVNLVAPAAVLAYLVVSVGWAVRPEVRRLWGVWRFHRPGRRVVVYHHWETLARDGFDAVFVPSGPPLPGRVWAHDRELDRFVQIPESALTPAMLPFEMEWTGKGWRVLNKAQLHNTLCPSEPNPWA